MKITRIVTCVALIMSLSVYGSEETFLGGSDPRLRDYKPEFFVYNDLDINCLVRVLPFSDRFFFPPSFKDQLILNLCAGCVGVFTVPLKASGMAVNLYNVQDGKLLSFEEFKFLKIEEGDKKGQRYNYGSVAVDKSEGDLVDIAPLLVESGVVSWSTLRTVDIWEF